jgi:PHP domain
MGRADPHCHTTASDGMVTPAQLVDAALALDIDVIAVCDHDTMSATAEVREKGEAAGLGVIVGMEITTAWPAQTHVLGWFLEHPVPTGKTLEETVDAIQAQGGLAIIPHPFMPTYFASCQPKMLDRLLSSRRVDGIEILHTAPCTGGRRKQLQDFYRDHQDQLGAAIGASDSHFGRHDLGRALTEFEGRSTEDFRRAVVNRATGPVTGQRSSIPAGLLARQQWRSLVQLPLRRLRGQC